LLWVEKFLNWSKMTKVPSCRSRVCHRPSPPPPPTTTTRWRPPTSRAWSPRRHPRTPPSSSRRRWDRRVDELVGARQARL